MIEVAQNPSVLTFRAGQLQLELVQADRGWHLGAVGALVDDGWRTALRGIEGQEFASGVDGTNGEAASWVEEADGRVTIRLEGETDGWEARSVIEMRPDRNEITRTQVYRMKRDLRSRFGSGFTVPTAERVTYTYPLRVFGRTLPLEPLQLTSDISWALPLPFHLLSFDGFVCCYGIDRTRSDGTLTLDSTGPATRIGVQLPDRTEQPQDSDPGGIALLVHVQDPLDDEFASGSEISLTELIQFAPRLEGEPFLAAFEAIAARALAPAAVPIDASGVASGIVRFLCDGQLWDKDGLGPGRGWYRNMWVRVTGDAPSSLSDGAGCFDFGWGEGIATETIVGALRHWRRTESTALFEHINELSRNIPLFRRGAEVPASYYDRFDGLRFCDFMHQDWVWTHSLAHSGLELADAYYENPNYPFPESRKAWLATAQEIGGYLARKQRSDGDLPDIFIEGEVDYDLSTSRIVARASACGLFVKMHLSELAGNDDYLSRALALSERLAPEIQAYEFNNNMLDAVGSPIAIPDGESAGYVLEGLVPLFEATGDVRVLRLCETAAAVASWWTYTYDLSSAYRGRTRGGQCCRMPDYPLAFAGGTAKHIKPLLDLWRLTDREIYWTMAREMTSFVCANRIRAAGQPWDGGLVHAFDQHLGYLWGPDREGQVDSGMTTGKGLAAIEAWLAADPAERGRSD